MANAMNHGFNHPLDVELADLAEDLLAPSERETLEDHLSACLLCRIKLRRLRDASEDKPRSPRTGAAVDGGSPAQGWPGLSVLKLPVTDVGADQMAPGQLWAAGGEQRLLVLIVRVVEGRALVAPVTFDVFSADEESIVVNQTLSRFGLSVAVYPSLAAELPISALSLCFGRLVEPADVGELLAGALASTTRGEPIDGPTDPRLEFRQLLADQLGSLEGVQPDPGTAADAPPPRADRLASALAAELRNRRGEACRVRHFDSWEELLLAYSKGWAPVATIDEAGTILVVFDTAAGLVASDDFNAALAVLTRFNATAVVVLATSLSPYAEVFDPPSLTYGIGVPSGETRPPNPLLSGLAPADAVAKFLDQNSSWSDSPWSNRASTSPPDVTAILSRQASAAIEEAVRQGRRAKLAPKIAGYGSVAPMTDDLARVLQAALGGEPLAQHLLDLAERTKR